MVGFAAGALAVLGYQWESSESAKETPPPAPPVDVVPADPPAAKDPPGNVAAVPGRPSLAVIEAVFAQWGDYALWESDRTEVALWNSATVEFSDFIEVVRTGGGFYFRVIPQLTRPWTEASPPVESPLRFTEPESLRRARREGKLERQGAGSPTGAAPLRLRSSTASSTERPAYLPPLPTPSGERSP